MKNHYLKDIDCDSFYSWLREQGWTEDTSPSTESWNVPAWWHAGCMVVRREDWLADDYQDAIHRDPFALDNPHNAPHLDR